MIDNLVILSNVVLVLWVVVRAILLDRQMGWFDPVGTPEHGGGAGDDDTAKRKSEPRARSQKKRSRSGLLRDLER